MLARGSRWSSARRRLKYLALGALSSLPRVLRDRWLLSRIHADLDALGEVVVKIAETPAEHEHASGLLHQAYVEAGLVERHGAPVRVTPFLMMPSTVRFVALLNGEVVATLSLVRDSELGLPLEEAYGEEIRALRVEGEVLAEIGALAVKPHLRGQGLTMLLYKALWKTAVEMLGVTRMVVAVRPQAAMFYEAALRFERLTPVTLRYPGINGDSAVLHLDLRTAVSTFERAFGRGQQRKRFNPFMFFVQMRHSQLRLPGSGDELVSLRLTHQQAALRLAWLRPEAVMKLTPTEFEALEHALSSQPSRPRTERLHRAAGSANEGSPKTRSPTLR